MWTAVIGATIGAFMAVLNIQIVNASLADIQGAIGAGIDDGGWISTAYLIAEIVVIPLSGWLARVFSIRIYLLTTAILFLIYIGYLAVRRLSDNPRRRGRWAAVVGIVGFADVPIVHLSVTWWRGLHQGPTVLQPRTGRPGPPSASPTVCAPMRSGCPPALSCAICCAVGLVMRKPRLSPISDSTAPSRTAQNVARSL